jgi:hypothetical protein
MDHNVSAIAAQHRERRRLKRERVLFGGRIVFGPFTIKCRIKDRSDIGIQVNIDGHDPLPSEAYLIDISHGAAYEVRQAWRRQRAVGLEIKRSYDLRAADLPPEVLPLHRIWLALAPT